MMSHADDMRAALACRPSARVPVWELEFQCWDAASGRHVVLGREFERLTRADQDRALRTNAEIIAAVARALGFAAVTMPNGFWEVAPGEPAYYWLPEAARWEQARLLKAHLGSDILLAAIGPAILTMPGANDYEEFCYRMHDQPEQFDAEAQTILARGVETAKQLRDLGVDFICAACDIADNHGPFFSPPQMERWILPPLRQWADTVRALGLCSVLHTDGNVTPLLEDLANSGLNALQAIDPVAGMDIRAAKAAVGQRLCLCGNVDCGLLQFGPPEKIRESARQLVRDLGPGGGFVLGASNAVVREIPLSHYRAMLYQEDREAALNPSEKQA
jgi:uroporphyrinogen decarboxylase